MNGLNGYQGQIRAIDQPNGIFTVDLNNEEQIKKTNNLFNLIEQDAAVPVHSIIRLGIQDFPAPYQPAQLGTSRQDGFKVFISDQADPDLSKLKPIQIGFNSMYELNDVNIKFFQAASNSSDRVIIDYIIQKGSL